MVQRRIAASDEGLVKLGTPDGIDLAVHMHRPHGDTERGSHIRQFYTGREQLQDPASHLRPEPAP